MDESITWTRLRPAGREIGEGLRAVEGEVDLRSVEEEVGSVELEQLQLM